ncbi:MAG: restriction endonuclease subunit S [Prevotella sp.]|nr:restriction endonuclease subunit S [Prevotella sp.]
MEIPQGYKRSEFGIIPEDWIEAKWGDCLATFSSGATPYRGMPAYYKGNVKWISSGELNYNVISDTIEHISEQAVRDTNLKVHQPGTMLIAITGLEAEGTRGRCALVGTPATTNQSCLALNETDKVCIEYLFEFYKMFGCALAFKYCQGTKQQSYTAEIVKKLPIIYPRTINEQKAIAKKLSEIDELIAGLGEQIEKKRQIKEGAMQQILTGKSRLPGFNNTWDADSLGNHAEIYRGGSPRPIESYLTDSPNGINWVKIGDVSTNAKYIESTQEKIIPEGVRHSREVHAGDFLLSNSMSFGRPYILKVDGCIHDGWLVIQNYQESFETEFLYYILGSSQITQQYKAMAAGSSVLNLNKEIVKKVIIPIPPIDEQAAIAQILSVIDDEITTLEAERDKYTLIKQGMMQELLTGKTRLL